MYPVMSTSVPWSLCKSGFKKTPHFNSSVQKTAAGRRSGISFMPYPTWDFSLDLNLVLGGEGVQASVLQKFLGCYLATCGGAGFFLFTDPNDNTVDRAGSCMLNVTPGAANPMAKVGDGTSAQFQLARVIDQGIDILQNVNTAGVILYVNAAPAQAVVSDTGVVSFAVAPPAGASLTWVGSFQYLCQFTEDTLKDLARVNKNLDGWLWSCGPVEFESVFA